jgi:HSP20 family molecular chaperone IbpA
MKINFKQEEDDKAKDKNVKKIRVSFDFEKMEHLVDNLMKDMVETETGEKRPNKPLTIGFKMRFDEKGQPVIENIGKVKPAGEKVNVKPREPLVDVIKGEKDITVTVELPGVQEKDIHLNVDAHSIEIKVENPSFFKRIEFEEELQAKECVSSLNNGIFEIQVKKN